MLATFNIFKKLLPYLFLNTEERKQQESQTKGLKQIIMT